MTFRVDRLTYLIISVSLALAGCATRTQRADSEPPSPDPLLVYETEVSTGDCVYGSGNESALAGILALNAITQGVNYFGKALEEAAKETNDHAVANRNVEVTGSTFGPCMQIVRGWFHRGFFSADESRKAFDEAKRRSNGRPSRQILAAPHVARGAARFHLRGAGGPDQRDVADGFHPSDPCAGFCAARCAHQRRSAATVEGS
jgi:hypothetical protein